MEELSPTSYILSQHLQNRLDQEFHTCASGDAAALCTLPALIIAGGDGGMYSQHTTMEVMDADTQQRSTAAGLRIP